MQQGDAFYALLAPTTKDETAAFLTVTVSDGTNSQDLTVKGIPATDAGNSYSFSLAVGKNMVTMGTVSVEDWTGGTIPGGEAGEIATYTYDEENNTYSIFMEIGLDNAINAANETTTEASHTIKLMDDIELTDGINDVVTLPANSNFIFDLNEKTLKGYVTHVLFSSGKLTIKNGTLTNEYDSGSGVYSNGTLTIESDVIINSASWGVEVATGGTCTIDGGDITGKQGVVSTGGKIEIKGGNITGTSLSVFTRNSSAEIVISGGNFKGMVYSNEGTITITGGTFDQNPSNFVDTVNYTVTTNEDGTYTVTAK